MERTYLRPSRSCVQDTDRVGSVETRPREVSLTVAQFLLVALEDFEVDEPGHGGRPQFVTKRLRRARR